MSKNSLPASAYAKSLILVLIITIAGNLGKHVFSSTNLLMFYLLGVVFVSVRWGRGPSVLASLVSAVAFDFFLVQPYFYFTLNPQHLFAFTGVLIVGLVVGELTIKTKEQANAMRLQESRTAVLKLQAALLHSISHDLRTPLSTITGSLSALIEQEGALDKEKKKELLEYAFEESSRLNRIVGNLLDTTRMEAGAMKVSLKPCELRDVIGVALQELNYKLQGRPVEIHVPRDFPEIPMDFGLIDKVIVNLVDNALKYSPDGTPIEIHAEISGGRAKITISNQGEIIHPENLKNIFEKFYRAENAEKISGLGLGLWICKGIVEAHGGNIRAVSPYAGSGGMGIVMDLPLKEKEDEGK